MSKISTKVKKEVLVLEDDPDTLSLIEKILINAGFLVAHAMSIKDAMEMTEKYCPHLILCDIALGDDSGLKFLNHLKKHDKFYKIPVLIMSSNTSQKAIDKSLELGASYFVEKPIEANKLIQTVKRGLKEYTLPTINFENGESIQVQSIGNMIKINEISCILQSSVKIPQEQYIKIKNTMLEEIGAGQCRTKTVKDSTVATPGIYNTEFLFQGMDDVTAQKK
jgi:DNA-binding NtrC family response regulator